MVVWTGSIEHRSQLSGVYIMVCLSTHDRNGGTHRNTPHRAHHRVPTMSWCRQCRMGESTPGSSSSPKNGNKGVSTPSLSKPQLWTLSPTQDLITTTCSLLTYITHDILFYTLLSHYPYLGPNTTTKPPRPSWSYATYGWHLGGHVTCWYMTWHFHQPWIQFRSS